MRSIHRWLIVPGLASALGVPTGVQAQCAGGAEQVGHLGLAQLQCDCAIGMNEAEPWRFWTEPRVVRIEPGSAAAGRLQPGDVIAAVNGHDITTAAGAAALRGVRPAQSLTMTIRRGGRLMTIDLRSTAVCPTDERRLGALARAQVTQVVSETALTQARGAETRAAAAETRAAAAGSGASGGGGQAMPARVPYLRSSAAAEGRLLPSVSSAGWVGLAFTCEDCGVVAEGGQMRWFFGTSPEVYSVEQGSPAHEAGMRRGDVLTHVDGLAITSVEGGRRWAALQPGEVARVTYRRAARTHTAPLSVGVPVQLQALRTTLARQDSAAARLLREVEVTLVAQAQKDEALRQLAGRLGQAATTNDRISLERSLREHVTEQEQLRIRQHRQLEELVSSLQGETLLRRSATLAPALASGSGGGEQRLRYSGTFAGSDIEVRGASSVVVTERDGELIITTADATIRVRSPRRD